MFVSALLQSLVVRRTSLPKSKTKTQLPSLECGWPTTEGQRPTTVLFCSRLSNLLLQSFARVAHTLILVRVRRTQRTHFRGDLPDLLAIDSGDGQLGLLGIDRSIDSAGQRILDGMRIAQGKNHCPLALHLSAVSDADDLQFTRPAFGYALDRIVDQGPRQAVKRRLRIILTQRHNI